MYSFFLQAGAIKYRMSEKSLWRRGAAILQQYIEFTKVGQANVTKVEQENPTKTSVGFVDKKPESTKKTGGFVDQ
jgi:hypothetical protein